MIDSRTKVALSFVMAAGLPLLGVARWLSSLEAETNDHARRILRVELQVEAQAKTLGDIRASSAATETKVDWLVRYFSAERHRP